jgi:hypothetical protein
VHHELIDIKNDFCEVKQKYLDISGFLQKDLTDLTDKRNNKKYIDETNAIIKVINYDNLP